MKKYVILGCIYNVGGWQTYINNKLKLMKENGWEIFAFGNSFPQDAPSFLPMLREFSGNNYFSMQYTPGSLSGKQRKKILSEVAEKIRFCEEDEVVFEATTEELLLWAEFFAAEFKARSLCVNVKNRFPKYPKRFLDFYKYKVQRNEFYMMINNGFKELFRGVYDYSISDYHVVSPLTYEMFYDDGVDYRQKYQTHKYDFVIGTIGWLNKPYYESLGNEIIAFANIHKDCMIAFFVIGESKDNLIENKYKKLFQEVENINLFLLGSMAPIPSNLIQVFNVCIASYGCAIISDKLRVKTIMMHDDDSIPLGIMGYTLREWPYTLHRANTEKSIAQVLEDVLVHDVCSHLEYKSTDYGVNVEEEKDKHLETLQISYTKEYYNVLKLKEISMKRRMHACILSFIGFDKAKKIRRSI